MMNEPRATHETLSAEDRAADSAVVFGFWMYLMSDLILFAGLFSVFIVLRGNVFGGASGGQIFSLPFVLAETLILLTSSFTCGLAMLAARSENVQQVLLWLGATALLGASFVAMEVSEFGRLIASGTGPRNSGFLSAYFTLVGTHGLHIVLALVWVIALMVVIARRGLTRPNMRKLMLWGMFWHFLDIVWIFIFTIVYLMGT
jgi:cytochrome o ubiquinol oxidase subunit 3